MFLLEDKGPCLQHGGGADDNAQAINVCWARVAIADAQVFVAGIIQHGADLVDGAVGIG